MATAGAISAGLIMVASSAVAKTGLPLVVLSAIFVGLMVYLIWLANAEVPNRETSAEDVGGRSRGVEMLEHEIMEDDGATNSTGVYTAVKDVETKTYDSKIVSTKNEGTRVGDTEVDDSNIVSIENDGINDSDTKVDGLEEGSIEGFGIREEGIRNGGLDHSEDGDSKDADAPFSNAGVTACICTHVLTSSTMGTDTTDADLGDMDTIGADAADAANAIIIPNKLAVSSCNKSTDSDGLEVDTTLANPATDDGLAVDTVYPGATDTRTMNASLQDNTAIDVDVGITTPSPSDFTSTTTETLDIDATQSKTMDVGISSSSSACPSNSATPSRLLALPPELRNVIYELVFALTSKAAPGGELDIRAAIAYRPEPTLLAVCHQIRCESSGLYTSALREFWKAHKVVLRISNETLFSPCLMNQLLGECQGIPSPGLQNLVLHVGTPRAWNPLHTQSIEINVLGDAVSGQDDTRNNLAVSGVSTWMRDCPVNMLALFSHIAVQNGFGSFTQMDSEGTVELGWSLRVGACVRAFCAINAEIQSRKSDSSRYCKAWMISLVVMARTRRRIAARSGTRD